VLDLFRYRGGGDDTTADNACFGMHSHVDPGLLTAKYVRRTCDYLKQFLVVDP